MPRSHRDALYQIIKSEGLEDLNPAQVDDLANLTSDDYGYIARILHQDQAFGNANIKMEVFPLLLWLALPSCIDYGPNNDVEESNCQYQNSMGGGR